MKTPWNVIRGAIGLIVFAIGVVSLPFKVMQLPETAAPWLRLLNVIDQVTFLRVFCFSALLYIVLIDARPLLRKFGSGGRLKSLGEQLIRLSNDIFEVVAARQENAPQGFFAAQTDAERGRSMDAGAAYARATTNLYKRQFAGRIDRAFQRLKAERFSVPQVEDFEWLMEDVARFLGSAGLALEQGDGESVSAAIQILQTKLDAALS